MLLQLFVHAALIAGVAPGESAVVQPPDKPPVAIVVVPNDPNVTRNENGAVSFLGTVDVSAYGETVEDQALGYFKSQLSDSNSVEFTPLGVENTNRGAVVHFRQTYRGVPVEGTYAMAVVDRAIVRYAAYVLVRVPDSDRTAASASVAAGTAQSTGVQSMSAEQGVAAGDPNLVIAFDAQGVTALAWRVPVRTAHPAGTYAVYVSATDNTVIGSKKTSRDAITGNIKATVNPVCEGDMGVPAPMPFVQWAASTYADAGGQFTSASATTATVQLTSPYLQLFDQSRGGSVPPAQQAQLPATGGGTNTLQLSGGPSALLDAYYNFHKVRNWLAQRSIPSKMQRAWVDRQVTINVNIPDSCNAFYTPLEESLNFFSAGDGCANTGTMPLVMHHEYGHAVQDHSGNAGNYDLAMAEGTADVVAIYSGHADHLQTLQTGCTGTLRTCANTYSACSKGTCTFDNNTEGHTSGQVICGVWYDLRNSLQARYGGDLGEAMATELFLNYLTSINGTMADSYESAVAMDMDTDDNPTNGTVHSCEINRAFKPHLPDLVNLVPSTPSLAIQHTAPGVIAAPAPLQLTASFKPDAACSASPKLTGVAISYRVNGDTQAHSAPMQDAGNGNYTVTLSDVQAPATVRYTFTATLDGVPFTEPFQHGAAADANGPVVQQTVRYAQQSTLFSSDLEADNGGLTPTTDNADGSSDWQWGAPATADTLTPFSGKKIWGTNLQAGGDVVQRRGRTSTLKLPTVNAAGYAQVHLQYWDRMLNPDATRIDVNGAAVASRPAGSPAFRAPGWMFHDVDITAQAAGKADVTVSFVAQNNPQGTEELAAWNLDNIVVAGSQGGAGGLIGDGNDSLWGTTRGTCASSGVEPWALLVGVATAVAMRRRA